MTQMTIVEMLITIVMVSLGTAITRFLPFILFPASKPTPKYILYLGKVLPTAVIGLLVVYCVKNITLTAFPFGLPELIAIACVIALHCWKRNVLLSIGVGTVLYMVLVQVVFASGGAVS